MKLWANGKSLQIHFPRLLLHLQIFVCVFCFLFVVVVVAFIPNAWNLFDYNLLGQMIVIIYYLNAIYPPHSHQHLSDSEKLMGKMVYLTKTLSAFSRLTLKKRWSCTNSFLRFCACKTSVYVVCLHFGLDFFFFILLILMSSSFCWTFRLILGHSCDFLPSWRRIWRLGD